MIGISIDAMIEKILAKSALHYLTKSERPALLTPDSRRALREAAESAWHEIASRAGNPISNWKIEGDVIMVELMEGIDESRARGAIECAMENLIVAWAYGLTYPSVASAHRQWSAYEIGLLREMAVGAEGPGRLTIKGWDG